jgi:hypothetical protein
MIAIANSKLVIIHATKDGVGASKVEHDGVVMMLV